MSSLSVNLQCFNIKALQIRRRKKWYFVFLGANLNLNLDFINLEMVYCNPLETESIQCNICKSFQNLLLLVEGETEILFEVEDWKTYDFWFDGRSFIICWMFQNRCLFGINFRSCRWGPRSPSAHAWRVRSSPHQHERKLSGARVCRVTFKHLPQPLRSHIRSFGTLGQLFLKCHSAGVGGVPEFFWGLET